MTDNNLETQTIIPAKVLNFISQMSEKLPKLKAFENSMLTDHVEKVTEAEEKNAPKEDLTVKIAELVDKKLIGG
jgi:hypothetical protein